MDSCHLAPLPRMSVSTLKNQCQTQKTVSSRFRSFLWHYLLSNGAGAIFPPSLDVIQESPRESQTASGPSERLSTPSTPYSDPPQEGPQEVIAKPFEGPPGDQHVPEIYPHLSQRYEPPPSQPPQKKREGLMHYLNSKFPGSFRHSSIPPGQSERRKL